jgi:hypothetical protein
MILAGTMALMRLRFAQIRWENPPAGEALRATFASAIVVASVAVARNGAPGLLH